MKKIVMTLLEAGILEEDIHRILDIIESEEPINFTKRRSQGIINKNAEEINRMMQSGELDNVRIRNGKPIGDANIVNKLNQMKDDSDDARGNL